MSSGGNARGEVRALGQYIDCWANLQGHVICVRKNGRLVRIGQVEVVTPDGNTLWLRSEGVEHRALIQRAEGYTAWTLPDPRQPTSVEYVFYEQGDIDLDHRPGNATHSVGD